MQCRKVIVLWFGSIEGHGTVGDLLSVEAACAALSQENFEVECASWTPVGDFTTRRTQDVDPEDYAVAVFVCGPIMRDHKQLAALFEKFRTLPLVGVGVSLFSPNHWNYVNPFASVLAREGGPVDWFDIALALPGRKEVAAKPTTGVPLIVGVSLRGLQGEYSSEPCLHFEAKAMSDAVIARLAESRPVRVLPIEHRLADTTLTPVEIESAYSSCDLVITTRLHGALLSLRHRVPFIALDQITGGAKVSSVLADCGWPFVFRMDSLDEPTAIQAAIAAISPGFADALETIAQETEARAQQTLIELVRIVRGLMSTN